MASPKKKWFRMKAAEDAAAAEADRVVEAQRAEASRAAKAKAAAKAAKKPVRRPVRSKKVED